MLEQARGLVAEMLASRARRPTSAKTGYGLSVEGEARAARLGRELGADRVTGLFAHAVPHGYDADAWMDEVDALAAACDVDALDIYVESVAFANEHLARLGAIAAREGVPLRAHVEQFNANRSVPVALAAGARSVDHLACLHPDDLAPLAAAECAAVLLPGAEFLGAERVAPARALADAGAICVLATDCNPGTSPVSSLPLIIGLAVRRYGWSVREALLACTLNAAWVLGLSGERGSIEVGKRADLVLLDTPVDHLPYRFGRNPVCLVVRAGEVRGCGPTPPGGSRRDRRRRPGAAPGRPRAHRPGRARHHAAGVDGRGRGRGRVVRPPGGRGRPARGARPRRQPLGAARRAGPWWGVGSHLDSVRAGGRYDGALGVCAGFAVAEHAPVAVIAFADEEGARFNTPTFGSRALAGVLDPAVLERRDDDGVRLADAMAAAGVDPAGVAADAGVAGAPARLPGAARRPDARPRALRRRCAASRRGCACRPTCTAAPITPGRPPATSAATRCCARAILIVAAHQRASDDMVVTASRILVEPNALTTIAAARAPVARRALGEPRGAHRLARGPARGRRAVRASRSDGVAFDAGLRAALGDAGGVTCFAGHDAGILAQKLPAAMVLSRNPTASATPPRRRPTSTTPPRPPRAILEVVR